MNRDLIRYYKKQLSGKSVVARVMDFVTLRLSLFMVLYIFFMYSFHKLLISVALSLLCVAVISVMLSARNRRKLERYIEKQLEQLKTELIIEKLVLMDEESYAALSEKMLLALGFNGIERLDGRLTAVKEGKNYIVFAYMCHPSEKSGLSDVLGSIRSAAAMQRSSICILSPSGFTDEVDGFVKRMPGDIVLIGQEDFLSLAKRSGLSIDEETAMNAAREIMSENIVSMARLKSAVMSKSKAMAYLLCGVVATAWIFVAGFNFIYPALGLACFTLAFLSYRKGDEKAA